MGARRRRGRARALRRWRTQTGRRRDGAGALAELRCSVRGKRRPAAPRPRRRPRRASGTAGGQGKAARGHRRRPRPSPVGTEPSSVVAPLGCEKRRLTASGGARPVSGSGSWLSRAAPKERERSHGSRHVRARQGVSKSLRLSPGSNHRSVALSCCPAAAVPKFSDCLSAPVRSSRSCVKPARSRFVLAPRREAERGDDC